MRLYVPLNRCITFMQPELNNELTTQPRVVSQGALRSAMTTRIREVRRRRGLTLQSLAEKVGTTPQTIQRLETNNMTVSIDWLLRIADALELSAADLLEAPHQRRMLQYIGDVEHDGSVTPATVPLGTPLVVHVPCDEPVAVKVKATLGPFGDGTILVAEKLDDDSHGRADGRDCLVALRSGSVIFRRIVVNGDGTKAFVPYIDRAAVDRDLDIEWIAPVIMSVRYAVDHQPSSV